MSPDKDDEIQWTTYDRWSTRVHRQWAVAALIGLCVICATVLIAIWKTTG